MAPFAEVPIVSLRDSPPVEVFKEPDLLDEWWRSESIYSLERRAIFSQVRLRFITIYCLTLPDMGLHYTWQPLHQAGRLHLPRACRLPSSPYPG